MQGPRNSVVEYLLGKEEVTGSSPVVGSINQSVIAGIDRLARLNFCLRRHSNGKGKI